MARWISPLASRIRAAAALRHLRSAWCTIAFATRRAAAASLPRSLGMVTTRTTTNRRHHPPALGKARVCPSSGNSAARFGRDLLKRRVAAQGSGPKHPGTRSVTARGWQQGSLGTRPHFEVDGNLHDHKPRQKIPQLCAGGAHSLSVTHPTLRARPGFNPCSKAPFARRPNP